MSILQQTIPAKSAIPRCNTWSKRFSAAPRNGRWRRCWKCRIPGLLQKRGSTCPNSSRRRNRREDNHELPGVFVGTYSGHGGKGNHSPGLGLDKHAAAEEDIRGHALHGSHFGIRRTAAASLLRHAPALAIEGNS